MNPGTDADTVSADPERLLCDFDFAWQRGQQPRIEEFLMRLAVPAGRRALLEELIKIDLEYRWRQAAGLPLDNYLARFPELMVDGSPGVDLVGWEYRVRRCWGDRPNHEDYAARFPDLAGSLGAALHRIDSELAVECQAGGPAQGKVSQDRLRAGRAPPPAPVPLAVPVGGVSSVGGLLEVLRRCELITLAQMETLRQEDQGQHADPANLTAGLRDRGWLTSYQADVLLQGRGPELLVGPYLIQEPLGQGGVGQVFKARHLRMDRPVALKLIRSELLHDAEVVGRFYREFRLVGQLSHANVVQAYDAGPIGSAHVLVMEYVEGVDQARLVKQHGPLPAGQAAEYIRQAACGLAHIHEKGLVHRDIKPSNLLVSRAQGPEPRAGGPTSGSGLSTLDSGLVKILDLGLARLHQPVTGDITSQLTPTTAMMGTPDYLAPEQAIDFHAADSRADIYSLGCTFYYLLTGQPPFPGGTLAEKLLRHQQQQPLPVTSFRADVPAGLNQVLDRMLRKRPEDRYQSAGELARRLAEVMETGVGTEDSPPPASATALAVSRTVPPGDRDARPGRAHPKRRFFVAGLVAGLGLAIVTAALISSQNETRPSSAAPAPPTLPATGALTGSVLDNLGAKSIPLAERFAGQPPELVAVLGQRSDKPDQDVQCLAWHPGGSCLASGHADHGVRLWQFTAAGPAPPVVLVGHSQRVQVLEFDRAGKTLISGGWEGTVRIWDLTATGAAERVAFSPQKHEVGGLAIAPDGKMLATAGDSIKLWDLTAAPPKETQALRGQQGPIRTLIMSADGKLLASGGFDKSIRLWDLTAATVRDRALPNAHANGVRCLAFAADGKLLASGSADRQVCLWNLTDGKLSPRARLEGHTEMVNAVVFDPTGKLLASAANDSKIIWWDVAAGKRIRHWQLPSRIHALALAPDGRHLATANGDGTIYLFRLAFFPSR